MSSSSKSDDGNDDSIGVDPIVVYECKLGGRHAIPDPEVRLLKTGDGGFIAACDCSAEPLSETHESPHKSTDHMSNIYIGDPSPEEWLRLESHADTWYDVDPWEPPEGERFEGSRTTRRQQFKEKMGTIADEKAANTFNEDNVDRKHTLAREVECPVDDCEASPGSKCKRPSGHTVPTCHADRVKAAREEGFIESDTDEKQTANNSNQTATLVDLSTWS
jgi:hypothetical protein